MQQTMIKLLIILISLCLATACTTSKRDLIGDDRPTMKQIHDEKFNTHKTESIVRPSRVVDETMPSAGADFVWLPNPTLEMYVFKHITTSGHFVPSYVTFFRLYTQHHIALPSEEKGWQ